MRKRSRNETYFGNWDEIPGGGRRYWHEVMGHNGWKARYMKEVDASENTMKFSQEIYDEKGELVEMHEKYPIDKGHQSFKGDK